ncbi:MAG TPA: type II toxin-antitoxin system VapC family toxin [Thermoanaerobaculia bacterium]|nr:type II toxin-antitoxin system VapC family toxin [Thermoanaerobaculia bacterium]
MRFWDSSALIPLLIREKSSDAMRTILTSDRHIAASVITPIEIESALWRRRHHGDLDAEQHAASEETFAELTRSWSEIGDIILARGIALDLLSRHVLRAADAIQLATAIVAAGSSRVPITFVTLDLDLANAARAEGFEVLS